MKPNRSILSHHRLQRLVLWTLSMLHWIAATLFGNTSAPRHRRQRGDISINRLTRLVAALIIFRALPLIGRTRQVPRWRRGRDLCRAHFGRSLLGAKLRRALNHKHLPTHIAQLITILRNLDAYAARLAYRLRHLRRLWRVMPPIAPAVALYGAPASPPAFADSS